jgi:photosystem II stability/assembly factor-like uncharacterized protein
MRFALAQVLHRVKGTRCSVGMPSRRSGRSRRRPMLELLEDRRLLASWTAFGPAPINHGQTPGNEPVSGRIVAVAGDPDDPNTIYTAAAGGGVWKTTDGGTHWTPQTDSQETLSMGAIALDPGIPNVIYAGTGEANHSGDSFYGRGVLKSTDGGSTWSLVGQFDFSNDATTPLFDRRTISKIVVTRKTDPTQADDPVYVAVAGGGVNGLAGNTGIWKSTDGGTTWTNTTASISTTDAYTDLVASTYDPNTLYAASGTSSGSANNGVWVTVDGGADWHRAGDFPAGATDGRIAIANMSNNYNLLFAAITDPNTGGLLEMMQTTNGYDIRTANGTNDYTQIHWTMVPIDLTTFNYLGQQGWYDTTLAIDPVFKSTFNSDGSSSNTYTIYGGGSTQVIEVQATQTFANSSDSVGSWSDGSPVDISVDSSGNGPHVDHHALGFDANGNLLDGNDGGLCRRDPNTGTWTDLNGNLQITQFYGVALHPTDANIAYGGSQDNGTEKYSGTLAWTQVSQGDGGYVRVDSSDPNTVYHTFFRDNTDGTTFFERSDDGGATWSAKTTDINPADPSNFIVPYVMDPSNPARLVLGTNRIYETTDHADTWHNISAPSSNGWNSSAKVDAVTVSRSDPNTIYATAGGKIFVTTDDGTHWVERDVSGATDHFADLAVDSTNSQVAYVVRDRFDGGSSSGHVFRTTNGGQTWTDISSNLPDLPTDTLALFPGTNTLYVGNDKGVYVSNNLGGSWSRFGTGLPDARAVDLELNTTLGIVAVGTHGRGMWEIQVENDPPPMAAGGPVTATEGRAFNGVVASFTDADPNATAAEYTATITWGDGSSSDGTIQADSGGFRVLGTHTYNEEGSCSIGVAITDVDNSSNVATTSSPATVADAPLTASFGVITAVEGAAFSGVAASFTDADPNGTDADYAATITWGDGQQSDGTIAANGGFTVSGTHTYAEEGKYSVSVTIKDVGGSTATATSPATVADAMLNAINKAIDPVQGQAFTGVVASFTDDDLNGLVADYAATITWGDGNISAGKIAANGGGFDVTGTNAYASAGVFTVTVTINDVGGSTATAVSTASVQSSQVDPPITARAVSVIATEGVPARAVIVATFTDPDPLARAGEYRATITWGDGSPTSAGTIMTTVGGGFTVTGSHNYAEEGAYQLKVTIADVDDASNTAVVKGMAKVADAPLAPDYTDFLRHIILSAPGKTFAAVVSSFTDADPKGTAGDYTATIAWGDGASSAGAVSANGRGGFDVTGSHGYARTGLFVIGVIITDVGGSTTFAIDFAFVFAGLSGSGLLRSRASGFALAASAVPSGDASAVTPLGADAALADPRSSATVSTPSDGFPFVGMTTDSSIAPLRVPPTQACPTGLPRWQIRATPALQRYVNWARKKGPGSGLDFPACR